MRSVSELSIQTRIVLLVAVVATAMVAAAIGTDSLTRRQADSLSRHLQSERESFYGNLLDLQGARIKAVAFDYTYWDEMVNFVTKPTASWASNNLDTALSTYDIDNLWVFTPSMKEVYGSAGDHTHNLKSAPFPQNAREQIAHSGPYYHFFIQTVDGLMEVRGASIHGSSDDQHTGSALGYMFAGRIWDDDYLRQIKGMTSSRSATIVYAASTPSKKPGSTEYDRVFTSWDGKEIGYLALTSDDPVTALLVKSSHRFQVVLIIFSTVVLLLVSACLYLWVSRPLLILSRALSMHSSEIAAGLMADSAEMGTLARLLTEFFRQKEELKAAHDMLELRVAERTDELAQANRKLVSAYDATIEGWSRALDLRDHETEGHSRRVTEMTLQLAKSFGITDEELANIERGSMLHDIGKMGVPDHILLKKGPLTDTEWNIMRKHPDYAFSMLRPITFLRSALAIPYCHHEKWDGTGYPRGISGEQIPFAARLFAASDVWDALASDRPYRRAWKIVDIREYIQTLSGSHLDPEVVNALLDATKYVSDPVDRAAAA